MPEVNVVETKELIQQVHQKVDDFKRMVQEAEAKGEAKRGELQAKLLEMGAEIAAAEERINIKLQKLAHAMPSATDPAVKTVKTVSGREVSDPPEFMAVWRKMLVHGPNNLGQEDIKTLSASPWARNEVEKKALATDSDTGAGFFVPPTMEAGIEHRLLQFSPIRQFARGVTVGTSAYEFVRRSVNRFPVTDVGERTVTTRNNDITPAGMYEKVRIDVYESATSPAITLTALEDATVDLEAEIAADAELDFVINEGRWFVSGSGVGEPQGFLNSPEVPTVASGLAADINWDSLIHLITSLTTPYAIDAAFTFARLTAGYLLQLKDGAGNYIWRPSQLDGMPSTLLGYKWFESIDMPAPSASSDAGPGGFTPGVMPVCFANWKLFYRIVDRRGIRVIRDMYTQYPIVIFKMSKRVGGRVALGESGRLMVVAA